jgi:hypothetical protein
MSIRRILVDFGTVFVVTLVVSAVVTLLWGALVRGAGVVDWETSFRFAIVFGVVIAWFETLRRRDR